MILIKNIKVFSPKYLGIKDVLIANEKISLISRNIDKFTDKIQIIDGKNKILIPGLIDNHVHIVGGGGEGGYITRVPEITLSRLLESGITTVVGLLGTDSVTKNIENLIAKAKSLKEEGLSVYTITGSYDYPSVTLTGSVKKDIIFIEEMIGVKIALSDHRSPNISYNEFTRLCSDARVSGMISGKAGIVVIHVGDGENGLNIVKRVLKNTEIPIKTFRPTHVNRSESLLKESFDFAKAGGIIDLTCGISEKFSPANIVKMAKLKNIPLDNITISSDGYGSWSNYNIYGELVEIGVSSVSNLLKELKKMTLELGIELEESLQFFTSNVSKSLNLYPKKGVILENSDADLLIIDNDINLLSVIAKGKLMLYNKELLVKGIYE